MDKEHGPRWVGELLNCHFGESRFTVELDVGPGMPVPTRIQIKQEIFQIHWDGWYETPDYTTHIPYILVEEPVDQPFKPEVNRITEH